MMVNKNIIMIPILLYYTQFLANIFKHDVSYLIINNYYYNILLKSKYLFLYKKIYHQNNNHLKPIQMIKYSHLYSTTRFYRLYSFSLIDHLMN